MREEGDVGEVVVEAVRLARERHVGPGPAVLAVDGRAGSGKTTFAAAVAAETGATVVHLDELFVGWRGLLCVDATVVLHPLSLGRPASYRRYDWVSCRFAEEVPVAPADVLVLEGVTSGNRAWSTYVDALVWVEADPVTTLRRGMERDGEEMRAHWEQFQRDEAGVFAREHTRARADLVLRTVPAASEGRPDRA